VTEGDMIEGEMFYFAISNCRYLPTYFILFLWLIGFPHDAISTKSSVSHQNLVFF
jgi:hypothetical protein